MKPSASLDLIYADPTQAARIALHGKFEVISASVEGKSSVSQSVYLSAIVVDEKAEDGERIVDIRISDHDAGRVGLGNDIDRRFADIVERHPDFNLEAWQDREADGDEWAEPSYQDNAWAFKTI
jgi:hypothetical protein